MKNERVKWGFGKVGEAGAFCFFVFFCFVFGLGLFGCCFVLVLCLCLVGLVVHMFGYFWVCVFGLGRLLSNGGFEAGSDGRSFEKVISHS